MSWKRIDVYLPRGLRQSLGPRPAELWNEEQGRPAGILRRSKLGMPRRLALILAAAAYVLSGARVWAQSTTGTITAPPPNVVPLDAPWQAVQDQYNKITADSAQLQADIAAYNATLFQAFLDHFTVNPAPAPAPALALSETIKGALFTSNTGEGWADPNIATIFSSGTATYKLPAVPGATAGMNGTISVALAGDPYNGDPVANITVDGSAGVAGVDVATTFASGKWQTVMLPGTVDPTVTHTVAITFTNDAYGGTSTTDRNLYIGSLTETAQ